jgi:hypothetical protein
MVNAFFVEFLENVPLPQVVRASLNWEFPVKETEKES